MGSIHLPVLCDEAVSALGVERGRLYIDGTFGAGGYTRAIIAGGGDVLAIDCDPQVYKVGLDGIDGDRAKLVNGRFGQMAEIAASHSDQPISGIVLDLGVSSMQLETAERGFSFRLGAPLDMRMAMTGITAGDLVNRLGEKQLTSLIYHYGQERQARRVARAIITARRTNLIETTVQLAEIIAGVIPKIDGRHPATKVFQALRIVVNDEIGELGRGLRAGELLLTAGGVMAVVSFHSLEDRLVKSFFDATIGGRVIHSRHLPEASPINRPFEVKRRKAIKPSEQEIKLNRRARSARLRFAKRNATAYREREPDWPRLVQLAHDLRASV